MNIILNNVPTPVPAEVMTVADLANWKGIKPQGTAIAINDKIVRKENWCNTCLKDFDRVTVISAAFGG